MVLKSGTEEGIQEAMRGLFRAGIGEDDKPGDWKALVAWLNLLGCRGDVVDIEERIAEIETKFKEELGRLG